MTSANEQLEAGATGDFSPSASPLAEASPTVAVVGGGPAGLMLSHLLARRGIDSVVIDIRTRHEIETTHRAGILEADTVRLLVDSGLDRVLRDGDEHEGIELRFGGRNHRIHFRDLVVESVWLYPQTDVFIDLADARARAGGDVRFGVSDVEVSDVDSDTPLVTFTDSDGTPVRLSPRLVVGADGSRSRCRGLVPAATRRVYGAEYPFAWFGILAECPRAADELVYCQSDRGFALLSQRTPTIQRMYLQCDPGMAPEQWSEERVWEEFAARLAGDDGFELQTGPILERAVLGFRSFVQEPMHHGRLVLAGDAAHTVPPTGAKGLNLALADVRVLAECLETWLGSGDEGALVDYERRALRRVWRAQHFSWWMTQLLHTPGVDDPFSARRRLGELDGVVGTRAGRAYLAEGYTGWPER